MPKKHESNSLKEKIKYLGIDFENIPDVIKNSKPLEYRIKKQYDEKQYRQYRYIPIKDIQILLTPTNRLDEIEEKYKKAIPLSEFLDNKTEENFAKHAIFLKMLETVKIEQIEEVEKEQEKLNSQIPFKVKFEGNYLWQIYYSENTDQYFMLVPTEDTDFSTFFYLLKKQIENKKNEKIFVPIKNVEYTNNYLRKSEIEDIENYLWLFTKDWPIIYEVYDKTNKSSIQIIGETQIYEKIKSPYKIKLSNREDAIQFYKLLKAMFILQTELPQYFEFKINTITKTGDINFYIEDRKIEYSDIAEWINSEYELGEQKQEVAETLIKKNTEKLEKLKQTVAIQEIEYLSKEKQISTFLECKKSFFGKFKYYFKYSKKNNKNKIRKENNKIIEEKEEEKSIKKESKDKKQTKKQNYNIEELVELYKDYNEKEIVLKNLLMDINSLKLKTKNMAKKIENATLFIEEIDSHRKSIFEFWKYSNKDELASLPEGEQEEINIIKKIEKVFDYQEDFENFGKKMDKMQRKILTKNETDSIYITTTNVIDVLNKIKTNELLPKDINTNLKQLKEEAVLEKTLTETEEFDIFGGISQDSTKVSKIKDKKHREIPKDKFSILDISKNTKQLGYKLTLENVLEDIKQALTKVAIPEGLPIYKAIAKDTLKNEELNIFNINPELEIKETLKTKENKINLYKINIKEGTNAISYTNIIYYDNQNKTLPIGQDLSTKILIDISKLKLELKQKNTFKILKIEDEKDDFSKVSVKTINYFEYNQI